MPNQAKRLQEQREWMRSYEQLKAWEEIVISPDDKEGLLKQITVSNASGSGTSKAKNARRAGGSVGNSRVLSLEREGGSRMNSDEIWVHQKEILTNEILLLICYIYYINQNAA